MVGLANLNRTLVRMSGVSLDNEFVGVPRANLFSVPRRTDMVRRILLAFDGADICGNPSSPWLMGPPVLLGLTRREVAVGGDFDARGKNDCVRANLEAGRGAIAGTGASARVGPSARAGKDGPCT